MSDWYEPLFRHALFPLYETGLRRRKTLRYLAEYQRNEAASPEQNAQLQWTKLKTLLDHCWREVPYYRRVWSAAGAEPGDIRTPSDFARLPLLTRRDVRECFDELHAASWRGKLIYKSTGGSTGEPMRFGYTRESYERRVAAMWRGYGWAGVRLGQRALYLWGAAVAPADRAHAFKDRLYHAAFNRRFVNVFLMTEDKLAGYADEIDRFKPGIIVAYVGPAMRLAEWLLATGRTVHRPLALLGAAEALHESQRKTLQRAFGCPAYNTYGCREFMLIASECGSRNGLHLCADHLAIEVHDPQPTPRGERIGDIVVTDLHNYGMPLVRYANGDMAQPSTRTCGCGRGLPLVEKVVGRKLDTIRSPEGHLMPGEYVVYVFLEVTGVKRYQVVQRELAALDITLVRDHDFGEHTLEQIRKGFHKAIGDSVALRFHYADDIAPSPSGKYRVSVSELA
jgi:phenylacetate-CoA ligase